MNINTILTALDTTYGKCRKVKNSMECRQKNLPTEAVPPYPGDPNAFGGIVLPVGCRYTPYGLQADPALSIEELLRPLARRRAIIDDYQFFIGDILVSLFSREPQYMERRRIYGEVEQLTGMPKGKLRQLKHISLRFPPLRRRNDSLVPYWVYPVIAPLSEPEQERILDRFVATPYSREALRLEVDEIKAGEVRVRAMYIRVSKHSAVALRKVLGIYREELDAPALDEPQLLHVLLSVEMQTPLDEVRARAARAAWAGLQAVMADEQFQCELLRRQQLQVDANNRRAQKLGCDGAFSVYEWRKTCAKNGDRCPECGKRRPLTIDHTEPLALRGRNKADNIQPRCQVCNGRKGARIGMSDQSRSDSAAK